MVKIWKIGAWPGLWKRNPTPEEKRDLGKRFINEYALNHGFVAFGSAYVKSNIRNLSDEDIGRDVKKGLEDKNGETPKPRMVSFRINKLRKFANIRRGEVILLYNDKAVYVGEATLDEEEKEGKSSKIPYYFVEKGSEGDIIEGTKGIHIAPHRVAVDWQWFEKQSFPADFSGGGKYGHRICQILKEDFEKIIKSEKLIKFLERKLKE